MDYKNRLYLLSCIGIALLSGCGNKEKPAVNTIAAPKKPVIMEPFRYHKLIEVSPGQDYDILSWGRGASNVGAFQILHSDSAAAKFTTTTGDLEGTIVDVYNSDMDLDGNPEIIIQAKGKDTTHYTNIYAFEFGNKANQLDFPKLNKSQREGYRGGDSFYIKEGVLYREFPVYNGTGATAKPSGAKRLLQYGLRNNEFTVKQLSKDSVSKSSSVPVKATAPIIEKKKKTAEEPKQKTKKKKETASKKHKTTKKKKRRHHSED